jgi:hypothetical protein
MENKETDKIAASTLVTVLYIFALGRPEGRFPEVFVLTQKSPTNSFRNGTKSHKPGIFSGMKYFYGCSGGDIVPESLLFNEGVYHAL